ANVMLGPFGETLIVDWGLAKVAGHVGTAPASQEALLHPSLGGGDLATEMGTLLGTPAYMSPEQAAGQLDLLGPASDVYSLGATLSCLLTGQAPFAGANMVEILSKVQRGDFLRPSQVAPLVPRALEALCRKLMAHGLRDRCR